MQDRPTAPELLDALAAMLFGQVRDWVPRLAAALDAGFVSDVIDVRADGGEPVFVRQPFHDAVKEERRNLQVEDRSLGALDFVAYLAISR